MKTYYSTSFQGINPVGACAIIRAENKIEAFKKLQEMIRTYHHSGLGERNHELLSIIEPNETDLQRIVPASDSQIILDGEY